MSNLNKIEQFFKSGNKDLAINLGIADGISEEAIAIIWFYYPEFEEIEFSPPCIIERHYIWECNLLKAHKINVFEYFDGFDDDDNYNGRNESLINTNISFYHGDQKTSVNNKKKKPTENQIILSLLVRIIKNVKSTIST